MKLFLPCLAIISFLSLSGCESRQTLDEVTFEDSKFGLEYIPDRSLEGYNDKYHPYFLSQGSKTKRFLTNPDDGFMFQNFPKHPALLDGIDVVIVDTIARTYEKYDRTEALTTLYVDPKLIDRAQWETLKKFISKNYSLPDSSNKLLKWMNYKYNLGDTPDSLYVFSTIYALVYTNISELEPEYASADSKRFLKFGVDDGIYFKDLSLPSPGWAWTGSLKDSVFHYWAGRQELINEFAMYERNGKKFGERYKKREPES